MTDTMSDDRMPPLEAVRMTEAQAQAVAAFREARGAAPFGPFVPLLRSPELMSRVRALGDYLRFEGALGAALREMAILLTAREWTQQFEWGVHQPAALAAGLAPALAAAIADGRRPAGMSEDETAVYEFVTEIHRNRSVSDPTYERVRARFGERGVVEIVGLVGYYTMLAMILNTARTPADAGPAPRLVPLPR
jgi:4-carboxymuconolactone decarboxylase